MTDPNNFTRVAVALERWVNTGAILSEALERSGDAANAATVKELRDQIAKLQTTISEIRG